MQTCMLFVHSCIKLAAMQDCVQVKLRVCRPIHVHDAQPQLKSAVQKLEVGDSRSMMW